jgi:hypothetical protein
LKRYRPPATPRVAFGLTAIALTVATFVSTIVLPAEDIADRDPAAVNVASNRTTEVHNSEGATP